MRSRPPAPAPPAAPASQGGSNCVLTSGHISAPWPTRHTPQRSLSRYETGVQDTYFWYFLPRQAPYQMLSLASPFLYIQVCPLPWVESALPFSREISLYLVASSWCQKGFRGKKANDSEGRIEWEICPKILSCYTDSSAGFIPDSFSQLVCVQIQKHSKSPFQSPCLQRARTSSLPTFTTRVCARGDMRTWSYVLWPAAQIRDI